MLHALSYIFYIYLQIRSFINLIDLQVTVQDRRKILHVLHMAYSPDDSTKTQN